MGVRERELCHQVGVSPEFDAAGDKGSMMIGAQLDHTPQRRKP